MTIEFYVGMNSSRAQSFLDACAGKHIHPATMTSLVAQGLIDRDKSSLTRDGKILLRRINEILEKRFTLNKAMLSDDELSKIEPTARFSRMERMKAEGIHSSDLKLLKLVAKNPGRAAYMLALAFGMEAICRLVEKGILEWDKWPRCEKYRRIYLTTKGLHLLEWCLEAA